MVTVECKLERCNLCYAELQDQQLGAEALKVGGLGSKWSLNRSLGYGLAGLRARIAHIQVRMQNVESSNCLSSSLLWFLHFVRLLCSIC